jgi:hypothetical protein
VRERLGFWWRVLRLGAGQINTAAGWAGTIFLALGIAGIAVPLVLNLSYWLIAVILVSLLVLVTAEGSYQVWHESDQVRKAAQAQRDEALRDQGRDVRNRSMAAAGQLAFLVVQLDWAVGVWENGNQDSVSSELNAAYSQFAVTEVAAAGELNDQELRRRVHLHSHLARVCLTVIGDIPKYRPEVARLIRDHARSILGALQAHQRGEGLPAYVAPPLEAPVNPTALFAWRSGL